MKILILLLLFITCSQKEELTLMEDSSLDLKNRELEVIFSEESLTFSQEPELFLLADVGQTVTQKINVVNKTRSRVSLEDLNLSSLDVINDLVYNSTCDLFLERFRSCLIELRFSPKQANISQNTALTTGENIILLNFNSSSNVFNPEQTFIEAVISHSNLTVDIKNNELLAVNFFIRNYNRKTISVPNLTSSLNKISNCSETLDRFEACKITFEVSGNDFSSSATIPILKDGIPYRDLIVNKMTEEVQQLNPNLDFIFNKLSDNSINIEFINKSRASYNLSELLSGNNLDISGCENLSRFQRCSVDATKIIEEDPASISFNGDSIEFSEIIQSFEEPEVKTFFIAHENLANPSNFSMQIMFFIIVNDKFITIMEGVYNIYDYDSAGNLTSLSFLGASYNAYEATYEIIRDSQSGLVSFELVYSPCLNDKDPFTDLIMENFSMDIVNNELNIELKTSTGSKIYKAANDENNALYNDLMPDTFLETNCENNNE